MVRSTRRPATRLEVALRPHEHHARRLLAVIAAGITILVAVLAIAVPVFHKLDQRQCVAASWPSSIRNSTITAETMPTCQNGTWAVTVTRDNMPEDAYGFNCYMDGNGICGPLEPTDRNCVTRTDDGYTMCVDGRVYYRDAAGGKLYPILRDPS